MANDPKAQEFGRRSSEFSLSPSRTWSLMFDSDEDIRKKRTPFNDPRAALPTSQLKNQDNFQGGASLMHTPDPVGGAVETNKPLEQFDGISPFHLPRVPSGGNSPELPTSLSIDSRKSMTPSMKDTGIQTSFEIYSGSPVDTSTRIRLAVGSPTQVHIVCAKQNWQETVVSPTEVFPTTPSQRRMLERTIISPMEILKSESPTFQDTWTQTSPVSSSPPQSITPKEQPVIRRVMQDMGMQTIQFQKRPFQAESMSPTFLHSAVSPAVSPPKLQNNFAKPRNHRIQRGSPTVISRMASPPPLNIKSQTPDSIAESTSISRLPRKSPRHSQSDQISKKSICENDCQGALVASMLAAMKHSRRKACPWPEASRVYGFGESTGIVLGSVAETLGSLALGILTGVSQSLFDTRDTEQKSELNSHIKEAYPTSFGDPIEYQPAHIDVFDGIICADLPSDVIGVPLQFPETQSRIPLERSIGKPTACCNNLSSWKEATCTVIPPGNQSRAFVSVTQPRQGLN